MKCSIYALIVDICEQNTVELSSDTHLEVGKIPILKSANASDFKASVRDMKLFPLAPIRGQIKRKILVRIILFPFSSLLTLQLSRRWYLLGLTVWVSSEPGHETSP